MKGDPKVIAILNEVLKAELTAINQYFLHAEMCENWGYERMAKHTRKESIEEMQHAEILMERILLLDGAPNMTDYFKINIGQTLKQQLENDLQLEYTAVKRLNDGIKASVAAGDNGSRELMEKILLDEEHHIDWLEGQLHAIKEMTYENYLAQQTAQARGELRQTVRSFHLSSRPEVKSRGIHSSRAVRALLESIQSRTAPERWPSG